MGNLEKRRVTMFSAALSDTSFLYFQLSLFTVLFLASSYFPYLRQDTYYELRKETDGVLLFFNTKARAPQSQATRHATTVTPHYIKVFSSTKKLKNLYFDILLNLYSKIFG